MLSAFDAVRLIPKKRRSNYRFIYTGKELQEGAANPHGYWVCAVVARPLMRKTGGQARPLMRKTGMSSATVNA